MLIGQMLGPYQVVEKLGAGGMGEVYRARDTRFDRSVAIKILPAHVSADPERRARFEHEAKLRIAIPLTDAVGAVRHQRSGLVPLTSET